MAKEENQNAEDQEQEPLEEQTKKRIAIYRFLTPKWIAILVVVSIIVHGTGFAYYKVIHNTDQSNLSPEVALGVFRFEADKNEDGRTASAQFSLHIALLDHVSQVARAQIHARRFRVQQDIEELLRQAHSGDFDDPNLGELKRQVQEQVNETLGMRAIADVIITDLKVERCESNLEAVTNTAETVPWVEKPSS